MTREQWYVEMKQRTIDFVKILGYMPSQYYESEKKILNFFKHYSKFDNQFFCEVKSHVYRKRPRKKYRKYKRKRHCRMTGDMKLGLKLAESGGAGF